MPPAKSHKLKRDDSNEQHLAAFGIINRNSDLLVSAQINSLLGINLKISKEYLPNQENPTLSFPVFQYFDENNEVNISLIKHSTANGVIFRNIKHIDYLIIFNGYFTSNYLAEMLDMLKNLPETLSVNTIEKVSEKNLKKLIL